MKIMNRYLDYLGGKEIIGGLKYNIESFDTTFIGRDDFLLQMCAYKNIIHFGFACSPTHLVRLENKKWLHKKLMDICSCCGIDIDKKAVNELKSVGISDIFCLDIEKEELPINILNKKWDIIILPEVIEHVYNPINLLTNIRNKLSGICNEMILTTPNVFRITNLFYSMRKKEFIHSDHRYWYSPYTLVKLMYNAGFTDIQLTVSHSVKSFLLKRIFLKIFPLFMDTLIIKCKI